MVLPDFSWIVSLAKFSAETFIPTGTCWVEHVGNSYSSFLFLGWRGSACSKLPACCFCQEHQSSLTIFYVTLWAFLWDGQTFGGWSEWGSSCSTALGQSYKYLLSLCPSAWIRAAFTSHWNISFATVVLLTLLKDLSLTPKLITKFCPAAFSGFKT